MQHLAGIARGVVPICRKCRSFSIGNKVDIVGVAGSNPAMPTIHPFEKQGDYICNTKFPLGSSNLHERFWSKVDIRRHDECWPWIAAKTGNGYGNFKAGRYSNIPSHRMAYWLASGVYPADLLVRHKCDNPVCCNPAHLELGTAADNAQDKVERGRHRNGHTGPLFDAPLQGPRRKRKPKPPSETYARRRLREIRMTASPALNPSIT